MTMRAAILGVLLFGACGGEPAADETAEPTTAREPQVAAGRLVDGYFTAEGAPDPLACTADADCTYGGALDETGCCWSYRDMNAAPMTTAYRDWSLARQQACRDAQCPSPPVPSQPPPCLFTVTCVAGRCANGC